MKMRTMGIHGEELTGVQEEATAEVFGHSFLFVLFRGDMAHIDQRISDHVFQVVLMDMDSCRDSYHWGN